MATLRDQILDALVLELNTGTPAGVPQARRRRFSTLEVDQLPIIDVVPIREESARVGGTAGPLTKRQLIVGFRCWTAGDAPEIEADALVSWITDKLSKNRLGGLANDIEEVRTEWAADAMDTVMGVAEVQMVVEYQTRTNDQELKA